jgi:hypothetical protein
MKKIYLSHFDLLNWPFCSAEAYFSSNGQLAKVINHDENEMPPTSVSTTDKTPHETTTSSPSPNFRLVV